MSQDYRSIAVTPAAEIAAMPANRRARIAAGLGTGDDTNDNNKPLRSADNGATEARLNPKVNKR